MTDDLTQIAATVRHLKDRQDILDCIQRESRARDRQDEAAILACWWEDGIDEHGAVTSGMPQYAANANRGHSTNFHATSHNITNHLCEIDGDTAHCESYVIGGLAWLDEKATTIAFGRYLDRLERREGEWRLLVRRCTIEMTADCDPKWLHSANVRGFLRPLFNGDDPSYDRPFSPKPPSEGVRW